VDGSSFGTWGWDLGERDSGGQQKEAEPGCCNIQGQQWIFPAAVPEQWSPDSFN